MSLGNDRASIKVSITKRDRVDPDLNQQFANSARERVELDGRRRFFALRDKWSTCIILWISTFVLFHILLTIAIGRGLLNFQSYPWLIPLIVSENFLQIVGMGYVIVRFLYPDGTKAGVATD